MLTLRWYIWNETRQTVEMLNRSIASFQRFLNGHGPVRYVIAADNRDGVGKRLRVRVDEIFSNREGPFCVPIGCFRKLSPRLRMFGGTEILIDLDIFCVREPTHLFHFLENPEFKGIIQSRKTGSASRLGYGYWADKIAAGVPPCCYGFLGMKEGYDFTAKLLPLMEETARMPANWFNDQGAVVKAMEDDILDHSICLLTEEGIRYFTPKNYPVDLDRLDTEMLHCISGYSTRYRCYKKLLKRGLI